MIAETRRSGSLTGFERFGDLSPMDMQCVVVEEMLLPPFSREVKFRGTH
jgi:hypothetical protein